MADKRIVPLTDTTIKKAQIREKDYLIADGFGLYIDIKANGSKVWTFRFNFDKKAHKTTFGNYPAVSLAKARKRRDEARELLADGINPIANKREKHEEKKRNGVLFSEVAAEYLATLQSGVSELYLKRLSQRIERNILPYLGTTPINDITHLMVLECIKRIEARGAIYMAHRTLNTCECIWRYAVSVGKATQNITANLDKTTSLARTVSTNYPHIESAAEFGVLLRAIDSYIGDFSTQMALRFAPLVFVRPANIRYMEWPEIDFDNALWHIPAKKMKMRRSHVVPLSRQALEILRKVQQVNGIYPYVFHSPVSTRKPLSENTLNMALMRLGYKDVMVSHGFRHTASTLLNENIYVHGFHQDVIEKQLAHADKVKVRGIYNKAEYLKERIPLMQWWADYLDELKSSK